MKEIFNESMIPNLKGKTIVITGGNSGIGYEAALMFAKKEANVVIASSNQEKSTKAVTQLKASSGNDNIEAYGLDLGDQTSIQSFAELMKNKLDQIDILVNNSGVMYTPYGKTKDGFEKQMGINHLGHFALTQKLYPLISKVGGRIVNIASIAHKFATVNMKDFFFDNPKTFTKSKGYNRSKLSNMLFTLALKHKLEQASSNVTVFAAHPGIADTGLKRYMKEDTASKMISKVAQSAYDGALPTVMAALNDTYPNGTYFGPQGFMDIKGPVGVAKRTRKASNLALALKLWELSEEKLDMKFEIS